MPIRPSNKARINKTREKVHPEKLLVELPRSAGDIRTVIAYPNRYWVAMSNLGFQAVYKLFSQAQRLQVERAYIPEDDESGRVLTYESGNSLSNTELLAISVSFETDYSYVLHLIRESGVVLSDYCGEDEAKINHLKINPDRRRPFLLGGGAALTLNPEPLARFFDAIVIGEGEEVVTEFVSAYLKARDEKVSFEELLVRLSQIEGIYVPALYEPLYSESGIQQGVKSDARAPEVVLKRYIKNIDAYPTHTIIQTPDTEFKSMFMTETGRGCEVGCKFCVAGYMYRPTRKRSESVISDTVQIGIESTDSIGFVGAAVSSHPGISRLAASVARQGKRAALSSIMSQQVTPELAGSLSESEYKTVALAPEAGSEELRFRIGKRVCNEQVVNAVETLAENGIRNFKLYFIVGLPSETLEDVSCIPQLVKRLATAAQAAARKQESFTIAPKIILSVNGFIPKAWTPFQRHPFLPISELKALLDLVRNELRGVPNVDMKNESPRESYFQTLMSRGDRRVGDLLVNMLETGADWASLYRRGNERILPHVPEPAFYTERLFDADEFLPWEIVNLRIKRSLLEREYLRTFDEDVAPLIERARKQFAQSQGATKGTASSYQECQA